jgi:hypothetical protein
MEPITTTLLTALIAGAAAATGEVAGQAIKDAYASLKGLLIRKWGGKADLENAVRQVEGEPKSQGRQLMLQEELGKAATADPTAAQDQELLTKAQELLKLLAAQGQATTATVQIIQSGSGGVAYGAGALAAGERSVVAHTIHGPVSTGDHARQITAASSHSDDPVAQSPALQSLRAILSSLYETETDARRIAQDAGLDIRQVNFSTKPLNFWQHLLVEAHKGAKVKALVASAGFEYPAQAEALRQAYQAYTSSPQP